MPVATPMKPIRSRPLVGRVGFGSVCPIPSKKGLDFKPQFHTTILRHDLPHGRWQLHRDICGSSPIKTNCMKDPTLAWDIVWGAYLFVVHVNERGLIPGPKLDAEPNFRRKAWQSSEHPRCRERLHQLQKEEDWPVVLDVYDLLVYGIVLFPHLEDYVDLAVIDCLDEALERTIRWYSKWKEREQVIVKCRGFPNVPLMGTQGGINYNLEVASRQAGYPMVLPPSEEAIERFIIHSMGAQNEEYFKRIRHALKNIIRKGREWGAKSCGASVGYKDWLKGRVKQIGLLNNNPQLEAGKTPACDIQEALKAEELEETLGQIDLEQKALKRKLEVALAAQVSAQEASRE
ncbi:hypothetical protein CR513_04610, partial [Mucuna pruriens]